MLIDWFTVAAQVINFLVLVWLLKKFLYRPILDTIDARERKVKSVLEEADAKKKEAAGEREEYESKLKQLEQQREDYLGKAKNDAEAERERLLEQARGEYEGKRAQFERGLAQEEAHLAQALSSRVRKEVFAVARKALHDLSGADVQAGIASQLASRLKAMGAEAKSKLASDFQADPAEVMVRSAEELSDEARAGIEDALNDLLRVRPQCRYEAAPDLIGGIEITVAGQKLAWSLREYLSSLENDVHEILKRQSDGHAKPRPAYEMNQRQNVGFRADQA